MSKYLNIEDISVAQENSEQILYVRASTVDLGPTEDLVLSREVLSGEAAVQKISNPEGSLGNYTLDEGLTFDNIYKTTGQGPLVDNYHSYAPLTVCSIFRHLVATRTEMVFDENYYTDYQGGSSFESFIPDLSDVKFNAKNIIVGHEKFNIVLVAIIKGVLRYEDNSASYTRNFPFKIVKNGELMFNYLDVKVNNNNLQFLKKYGIALTEDVYRLPLSDYPVFDAVNPFISATQLNDLQAFIDEIRLGLKALRTFTHDLSEKMADQFIISNEIEWFYGEPIEEDYISDAGNPILRVYRNKFSSLPSAKDVIAKLGQFGKDLLFIFDSANSIKDYDSSPLNDQFKDFEEEIVAQIKDGVITIDDALIMLQLLECYKINGSQLDRLKEATRKISDLAVNLNLLNLKLLSFRKDIFDNVKSIDYLGSAQMTGKDKWKFSSRTGEIVVVKSAVRTKDSITIQPDKDVEDFSHG